VKIGAGEIGRGGLGPEKPAQRGQRKRRRAGGMQERDEQTKLAVEVGVLRTANLERETSQAVERVVFDVAIAGDGVGVAGEKEQVALFGYEEEQQAIDHAQELAVVVLFVEVAGLDAVAQGVVGGMTEIPTAERGDGALDALAKFVEGTGALLDGGLGPAF
jgi:hypothetical protein